MDVHNDGKEDKDGEKPEKRERGREKSDIRGR